jgi:hypothetical protein
MADTYYDGIFGIGFSFTFTPTSGTPFGSAQAQVEEGTPPPQILNTEKYKVISGANAGKEQYALLDYPVQEYRIKATLSAAEHQAAKTCQEAKVKGSLVVTYSDGRTDTYAGSALTGITSSTENATGHITDDLVFTCVMPSTFSSGSTITVVQTSYAMTAGAVTIDLTASPVSGDGKTPIRAFLMNPAGNSAITVDIGASNGYDGFGDAFSITLEPGYSVQLEGDSEIGAANKTLDVTGTGTDSLIVQLQLQ